MKAAQEKNIYIFLKFESVTYLLETPDYDASDVFENGRWFLAGLCS